MPCWQHLSGGNYRYRFFDIADHQISTTLNMVNCRQQAINILFRFSYTVAFFCLNNRFTPYFFRKNMRKLFLNFHHVTFKYGSSPEPLFKDISLHFSSSWSGVIGANGTGKTTLLMLATGLLKPDEGYIDLFQNNLYCPQRTDYIPNGLKELCSLNTKSASIIKKKLGIEDCWCERWETLSHGERKRAQIGVSLWINPDVLAIDEPTNHVDSQAREIIVNALHAFDGIGVLVSHDRELFDSLCVQCLFTDPPKVTIRPGGITESRRIAQMERTSFQKQYLQIKRSYSKLQKEVGRRRELAKRSQRRRSKRNLAKRDHDAREKKDRARVTGKDASAGKIQKQLEGRLSHARKELEDLKIEKQFKLGIWLPGVVSKRDYLLKLSADSLLLGGNKRLFFPELQIKPDERIAVTGPNGSGKSTLIEHIVGSLNVPKDCLTYIPQEIDARGSQELMTRIKDIPPDKLGIFMTIVSRLGSRPQRLLDSSEPSPGEIRKLFLALGMAYAPHIIVMDEPTNHMDLPSIECLEDALLGCPCSLILVSHDNHFLGKLTKKYWSIQKDSTSEDTFILNIRYQADC